MTKTKTNSSYDIARIRKENSIDSLKTKQATIGTRASSVQKIKTVTDNDATTIFNSKGCLIHRFDSNNNQIVKRSKTKEMKRRKITIKNPIVNYSPVYYQTNTNASFEGMNLLICINLIKKIIIFAMKYIEEYISYWEIIYFIDCINMW